MVELGQVPEIFCSGLGKIENVGGGCLRFYLYVTQAPIDGGAPEQVLVAKLIAPMSAVPDAVLQMMAAVGERAGRALDLVADKLVH